MKQRGFTLLEVLIAMTLLGLLMVMLYQTLSLGARSWNAAEQRAVQVSAMRDSYRFLHNQIERMQPAQDLQGPEEERHFLGQAEQLRFVANLPGTLGLGGPAIHDLEVKSGEAGLRLELDLRLDHPDTDWSLKAANDDKSYVLIEGASAITFAYFGARNLGNEPDWYDRWEGENMPSMIRLHVEFEGSALDWPDLTVALAVDSNTQAILPGQGGAPDVPINPSGS